MFHDFDIYAALKQGQPVDTRCAGPSMEPVYFDGEAIRIFPFTAERPHPVVGDVVHFFVGRFGFNRHQVGDIFEDRDGVTWLRLVFGDGNHDTWIPRGYAVGYVVPHRYLDAGIEPKDVFEDEGLILELAPPPKREQRFRFPAK